jgi:hypothetical protein
MYPPGSRKNKQVLKSTIALNIRKILFFSFINQKQINNNQKLKPQ